MRVFNNGQLCFHTEPIRDTTNLLRGAVGNSAQLFVIIKRNGVDNNVVMYRIFIDMGSNDKLEFSIGKFHRKLATQLVGQLRRDGIIR